ncbi:MAG: ABC transporter ATP-binding protein [Candidatus Hydrogenedentes bacterium]|nr:ABC transporter ATP-binding protein [Candidatus Hydrogenedentota bacterium]
MNLLEIEQLRKGFRAPTGEQTLIVDIPAFTMTPGQHVALRGASGSGKTTFLNLIAGILKPDQGQIRLEGRDIAALSESQRDSIRANSFGYVFQTFNLLQGYTALENVTLGMMFGKGSDRAYAEQLLHKVGLADRMHYRPRQLSVGQQQRVAVARALANHPKLVLADEPTGNLDPVHAREALRLIREICAESGAALLLVSHDEGVLEQFDSCTDFLGLNRAFTGGAGG